MENLYNAMRKAVSQFGIDIMAEVRLIHILSDFGAFGSLPATKNILKDMLLNGDCQTIVNHGRRKSLFAFLKNNKPIGKPEGDEWKVKLTSLATNISQQRGFEKRLVVYVIDCIVYGIGWSDIEPTLHWSDDREKRVRIDTDIEVKSDLQQDNLSLGQNKQQSSSVSYQDIEDTQFVVMQVEPKNAEVFIDGTQYPVYNGIMAVELPIGDYTYEVKAESYKTQNGSFALTKASKVTLVISLEVLEQKIKLFVTAEDASADIVIDGNYCAKGKWVGFVERNVIEIECSLYGYHTYKETRHLGLGKQQYIRIPPLAPIIANLKINVQPYGSSIYINGIYKGTTPLMVVNAPVGNQMIRVITVQGREFMTTVDIKEGLLTEVKYIIQPPIDDIKPVDITHSSDSYDDVKIGDYFYTDGSISHGIIKGKTIAGIVFSLETSDEEKKHGWTHGLIVAIEDANSAVATQTGYWGIPTTQILQYAVKDPDYLSAMSDHGYKISHLDCIQNKKIYAPFYIAANYNVILPKGKTSGWYLPSIGQCKILDENTKNHRSLVRLLKLRNGNGEKKFATSSIKDVDFSWIYRMKDEDCYFRCTTKLIRTNWKQVHVRSIAAF